MGNNILQVGKNDLVASKEMIENGSYYDEALKWYNDIFVSIAVSKFIYIIFFATYSIALYLIFNFITSMLPLKVKMNLVIFTEREADTYLKVRPIKDFQGVSKNIAAITLKNYIIEREEYLLENYRKPFEVIKLKMAAVKNSSSAAIYEEFKKNVTSPSNSAYRLINSNHPTSIEIKNFNFVYPEQTILEKLSAQFIPLPPPSHAVITYVSTHNKQTEYWEADIIYTIDIPPSNAKKSNNSIKLKVESYITRKIMPPATKKALDKNKASGKK